MQTANRGLTIMHQAVPTYDPTNLSHSCTTIQTITTVVIGSNVRRSQKCVVHNLSTRRHQRFPLTVPPLRHLRHYDLIDVLT